MITMTKCDWGVSFGNYYLLKYSDGRIDLEKKEKGQRVTRRIWSVKLFGSK